MRPRAVDGSGLYKRNGRVSIDEPFGGELQEFVNAHAVTEREAAEGVLGVAIEQDGPAGTAALGVVLAWAATPDHSSLSIRACPNVSAGFTSGNSRWIQ